MKWFNLQYHSRAEFLFCIPNGGYRSRIEAKIMSGEGVRAGVSDLFLALPSNGCHGLFIEMKSQTGRVSHHQKEFLARQAKAGYQCEVCNSLENFIKIVTEYMKGVKL